MVRATFDFDRALERLLAQIPRGNVSTCGALAEALGDPRAATAVARRITEVALDGPAHRVVRADGTPVRPESARRLEGEGLRVRRSRVALAPDAAFSGFRGPRPLERLRREQTRLAMRVSLRDGFRTVQWVGGIDVAYRRDTARAAAVILDAESGEVVEVVVAATRATFPYIPTYLAYREFAPTAAAFRRLRRRPDLLFVDGNGLLHPTRFGFACLAGLQFGVPTIGCAKTKLLGSMERMPPAPLASAPVRVGGKTLGYAVRPAAGTRLFYVSPGHAISLASSVAWARRQCLTTYPEPLRIADRLSKIRK